jgi:hypothetical protein
MRIQNVELTPRGYERFHFTIYRNEMEILASLLAHVRRYTPDHPQTHQFLEHCRALHSTIKKALKCSAAPETPPSPTPSHESQS